MTFTSLWSASMVAHGYYMLPSNFRFDDPIPRYMLPSNLRLDDLIPHYIYIYIYIYIYMCVCVYIYIYQQKHA